LVWPFLKILTQPLCSFARQFGDDFAAIANWAAWPSSHCSIRMPCFANAILRARQTDQFSIALAQQDFGS
jgi:hypothetical protein